jgi:hypothetical protein
MNETVEYHGIRVSKDRARFFARAGRSWSLRFLVPFSAMIFGRKATST